MSKSEAMARYDLLLSAAVAGDESAVWAQLDALVTTRRDAATLLFNLAAIAATPIANLAAAEDSVACLHMGPEACTQGRAAGQIVATLANQQTDTAADLIVIVVDAGEAHYSGVLRHMLDLVVSAINAGFAEAAWAPVIGL